MSNAEDRSSSVNKDTCLSSRPKRMSFAVLRSNVCTMVRPVCGLTGADKIVMIYVIYMLLDINFLQNI